jgi:hypothetical protein
VLAALAVLVLTLVALTARTGLVPAAGASAAPRARAATVASAPVLTLAGQSPWVTPGGSFDIQLALGPSLIADQPLSINVTLYNALSARSDFAETLSGTPVGGVLDRAGPFPVSTGDRRPSLSIPVREASESGATGAATLSLSCQPGSCGGLYPLQVTVGRAGGVAVARLLTYLTFSEQAAGQPLRVALVLPLAVPVATGAATSTDAGSPLVPGAATTASLGATVAALRAVPQVPVTLEPGARTLQALSTPGHGPANAVVRDLAAVTATPAAAGGGTEDQVLTGTYVPVNAQKLAAAGLTGELSLQAARARSLLDADHITSDPSTYVADSGSVGNGLARALPLLGASRVVVPGDDVDVPDGTTFTQPFTFAIGRGAGVEAAAADPGLTAHFRAEPGDPVLAANQLLADLALIYFDLPNPIHPRGVVAAPPAGWSPNPQFVSTVLHGLEGNPDLDPLTLANYFATVPAGVNRFNAVEQPTISGDGPATPRSVVDAVAAGRHHLEGFADAARGSTPVESQLDDQLLAAEAGGLTPSGQIRRVDDTEHALDLQLSQFQLAAERTITLTASTGAIPVTVISTARYPVRASLTLTSDKFAFPDGPTRPLVLDHPTTPVSVQVVARTSGSALPVVATLTSPDGSLVLARGQLTVRSTALSLVGIVLTVLALAVLATWWARTWWAGHRRRGAHSRRAS